MAPSAADQNSSDDSIDAELATVQSLGLISDPLITSGVRQNLDLLATHHATVLAAQPVSES